MVTRLEVRPKARNVLFAGLLCAIFSAIGLWMVLSGEAVFVGLLSVLFFGGGGLYAIPKQWRRKVSMVLTSDGIEQRYHRGTTFIPWQDVESVGVVAIFSNKMVGIRLQSYDHYLSSMSPDLAVFFLRSLPYMKLVTRATALVDVPGTLWRKLQGRDAITSFGKVGDVAQALLWSRSNYGYDLLLSWVDIDRSASEFAALLEEYLASTQTA